MRIVQLITRPQRRGAEIFAVQLAEGLKKLGHDVWVISILKGAGGLNFSGGMIQLDLKESKVIDIKGFKKLSLELERIKPELVQANASDTLRYGVGARYFYAGNFQLVYRNANTISGFIRSKVQLYYNRWLHKHVDSVISVSEHSKADYQQLFQPKSISVIPIGIDPNDIEEKLSQEEFIMKSDYLLFVGSLVEEKDPMGLLKIFYDILKVKPGLKLIMLGSGPLKEVLGQSIQNLKISDSVLMIPTRENIFPVLAKAKALLMPSKVEGLPGVILEAMYCKVPVIAFGVGGIPEVLKNQNIGWCVNENDKTGFKSNLLKVLESDSVELEAVKVEAKNFALMNFQLELIVQRFEKLYRELLSEGIYD